MGKQQRKVPNLRFKGFHDEWKQCKLKDISKRVLRKNKNLQSTLPLTISAQDGLVDQTKYFSKQVASKRLLNYLLLLKGEFAYNKSYSVGYPYGAIKRLNKYDKGVLSTLYLAFKPIHVNSDFLQHYYDTDKWYREIYHNAAEGARNHGLLNISASDFFNTRLNVPDSKREQKEIAKFFNCLNNLIFLQQRRLFLLKQLKKGLLQKMFVDKDGKQPVLRFKRFHDDWKYLKLANHSKIFIGLVTSMTKHYSKSGTFLIRNSNITENNISHKNPIFLDNTFAEKNSNRQFKTNDVVTVHTGDIGTSSVISKYENGAIGFATIGTRPEPKVFNSFFLSDFLNTSQHKQWAIRMSTGDGRSNYNLYDFTRLVIPTPSLEEQETIANILNKLANIIFLHQHKLTYFKSIKKSLLQQMFI